MGKRVTGAIFCGIASFLFVSRYVIAAQFMIARFDSGNWTGGDGWQRFFSAYLRILDEIHEEMQGLTVFSLIALVVGVCYLIWAEYDQWMNRHRHDVDERDS